MTFCKSRPKIAILSLTWSDKTGLMLCASGVNPLETVKDSRKMGSHLLRRRMRPYVVSDESSGSMSWSTAYTPMEKGNEALMFLRTARLCHGVEVQPSQQHIAKFRKLYEQLL
ncbi:uncharacterized protein PHALS_11447 [Plasmopara halstedii]|uniref:Uncharacterized protein n=1 Tax=Plasmopara halstedii TaxID=4781 RepID=A0A0P1A6A5_PLAHL|nr:uncharacterized protein PHALS_11447 [Plasmopara halstedii]CEG35573.1 hypothetical protein PHALS_11447 [Plasmopara halstedii]|eukprot:XP_024571942.1 hypothetical protein PHALS_11447 [Plasmopara halstedii]